MKGHVLKGHGRFVAFVQGSNILLLFYSYLGLRLKECLNNFMTTFVAGDATYEVLHRRYINTHVQRDKIYVRRYLLARVYCDGICIFDTKARLRENGYSYWFFYKVFAWIKPVAY